MELDPMMFTGTPKMTVAPVRVIKAMYSNTQEINYYLLPALLQGLPPLHPTR